MDGIRRVVLQLELDVGDEQSVAGIVRASDGSPHEFAGWSEMFGLLQMLTADPDGGGQTARNP
ncbi:hypothetical protein [Trebonia sp.]|uniref:hypothetical protein n=1 Tax=Trebonia sp. TaxID=2767075 RepID=UPI0026160248|nr:hypothetical protein [Trebonia sp.]